LELELVSVICPAVARTLLDSRLVMG